MIPLKDDNPTRNFPIVTVVLIGINVVVFFFQLSLGPKGMEVLWWRAGAIPFELTRFRDLYPPAIVPLPLTLLTAMFLHGGFGHLIGNMLYLWIFGDNIEDTLGPFRFTVFYLLCGVLASVAHILTQPSSQIPMVGASGAIAGILGAYLILFPRAQVLTLMVLFIFIRLVKIPALIILGFWFLIQVFSASGGGGVAWFAHLGGFGAGMLLVGPFLPRRRLYKVKDE